MTDDPRVKFCKLIDLQSSRVLLAPHITFICGGPVDIRVMNNHSIRNMFMNLSATMSDQSEGFVLAENFKDWQHGYSNLADFESDIASLSSNIVIILESPGALAELGLFFANQELRKKMVVVVHNSHHSSESFIKFGLLNPLEQLREEAVLVYKIDPEKIDEISKDDVREIVTDIIAINAGLDKTSAFDLDNRGHVVFLIFQIIDLFTILTLSDVEFFMEIMGVGQRRKDVISALYILKKFGLINEEKRSSQTFYFVKNDVSDRVSLHFIKDESVKDSPRRYDTRAVKLEVLSFYYQEKKENRGFAQRLRLWEQQSEA
ncbi:MAG: retron St85 family effector protein [Allorhizobium sp.]